MEPKCHPLQWKRRRRWGGGGGRGAGDLVVVQHGMGESSANSLHDDALE